MKRDYFLFRTIKPEGELICSVDQRSLKNIQHFEEFLKGCSLAERIYELYRMELEKNHSGKDCLVLAAPKDSNLEHAIYVLECGEGIAEDLYQSENLIGKYFGYK